MKKLKNRFSIQFDEKNSTHANAIKMLNSIGRGKANLIAEALEFYTLYKNNVESGLNKQQIETIIGEILFKNGIEINAISNISKKAIDINVDSLEELNANDLDFLADIVSSFQSE